MDFGPPRSIDAGAFVNALLPVACMKQQETNLRALHPALSVLTEQGPQLAARWHFDWPASVQQTAHYLRCRVQAPELPPLVAVVGGASSGKSTVFNNLLEGHLASMITARSHATLGLILAVHESGREIIEPLLGEGGLLPDLEPGIIDLDDNAAGAPGRLTVLFHPFDALRHVILCDTPDFTSDAALKEGDLLLSLLPWFDRLVVVVDHERWFDRQSISKLRTASVACGQERMVLFNRTNEGALAAQDQATLQQQARQLDAAPMVVLEFRRGRGLSLFPPGTLDEVCSFSAQAPLARTGVLLRLLAQQAQRVCNQNQERAARLDELHTALHAAVERATPGAWDTLTALLTPPEREQLEIVARVLRLRQTKAWLSAQTRRVESALKRVPLLGTFWPRSSEHEPQAASPSDRQHSALSFYESVRQRHTHDLNRTLRVSSFWTEVRRWTGLEPRSLDFTLSNEERDQVKAAVAKFEAALAGWNTKVESECGGLSPHVAGAAGVAALGVALVLIAAPGSVAVLTLATAKSALGAALGKLAAAAGAGALFGKQLGRLTEVVYEKLIGSAEFDAVQEAAGTFRVLLLQAGHAPAGEAHQEAARLVLPADDPLAAALQQLSAQDET